MNCTEELIEHSELVAKDIGALDSVLSIADDIAEQLRAVLFNDNDPQQKFNTTRLGFALCDIVHVIHLNVEILAAYAEDIPNASEEA